MMRCGAGRNQHRSRKKSSAEIETEKGKYSKRNLFMFLEYKYRILEDYSLEKISLN